MNTFNLLIVAAFAVAMATASPTWSKQSSSSEDYTNNYHGSTHNQHHQANTFNADYVDNQQNGQRHWQQQPWAGARNAFVESVNQQQQQHQQRRFQSGNTDDNDWLADNWTDVQPFHAKITRRLEESHQLSNQTEIKRKIQKLADEKLNSCKYTGAGNKNKANRHCAGRATGQIMQLIAAFENGTRDLTGPFDF